MLQRHGCVVPRLQIDRIVRLDVEDIPTPKGTRTEFERHVKNIARVIVLGRT